MAKRSSLTVMQVNDSHAYFDLHQELFWQGGQAGIGGVFWLNIILTLLGYIPGIVNSVWIIAKR